MELATLGLEWANMRWEWQGGRWLNESRREKFDATGQLSGTVDLIWKEQTVSSHAHFACYQVRRTLELENALNHFRPPCKHEPLKGCKKDLGHIPTQIV